MFVAGDSKAFATIGNTDYPLGTRATESGGAAGRI